MSRRSRRARATALALLEPQPATLAPSTRREKIRRALPWVLGAGTLGLIALAVFKRKDISAAVTSAVSGGKVFKRENAAGVDPKLTALLDWWEANGPFEIMVPPEGGVRTDAQIAALYAQGRTTPGKIVTNAQTAADTAHGLRATGGSALDIYPVRTSVLGKVLRIYTGDEEDPAVRQEALRRFTVIGTTAESRGFVWGGRFKPISATTGLGWDLPHVEIQGWKSALVA